MQICATAFRRVPQHALSTRSTSAWGRSPCASRCGTSTRRTRWRWQSSRWRVLQHAAPPLQSEAQCLAMKSAGLARHRRAGGSLELALFALTRRYQGQCLELPGAACVNPLMHVSLSASASPSFPVLHPVPPSCSPVLCPLLQQLPQNGPLPLLFPSSSPAWPAPSTSRPPRAFAEQFESFNPPGHLPGRQCASFSPPVV